MENKQIKSIDNAYYSNFSVSTFDLLFLQQIVITERAKNKGKI